MIGYRKHENYTKAEQAWLEAIPSHWSLKKNKYIFTEKKDIVGENSGDYVLLSLTLQGIIPRDMENPSGKFPAEFNTYKIVSPNDIVFCLFDVEETPRTVGHSSHNGMITGAYDVVECSKDVVSRYIYYYYLYLDIDKRLGSLYTGLRKVITGSNFFNIKTPLPPLSEQQAIADFLDRKTAQIDTLIEKKQRQIDLLQEQRTALINYTVTKGLNPDVRMKDSGVEWLGEIPSHWKVAKLSYLTERIGDGLHGTPEYVDTSDYYFINGNNLVKGEIQFFESTKCVSKDEFKKYDIGLNNKTILLSINGTISSSRKGLNMVYLALTKETKPPCPSLLLKITESCDLNKY